MNKLNIVFTADAWEEYLEWKRPTDQWLNVLTS